MSRSQSSPIQDGSTAEQALAPLYATSISFLILNTVFLLLRFFAVLFLRRKRLGLTWDDWFLIPGWACTCGIAIIGLVMHYWETTRDPEYGGHGEIADLWRLEPILKSIFALLQLLVPAYAFTRFSILSLYLRVFTGRIVRAMSYFLIAFICCQWVAYSIASALQCTPVQFYWDKLIPNGRCVDINRFNRAFTPANIAADAIIIALPLPTIWKLNTSKLRKAGYTFILGMGSFALAASIVRAVTLQEHDTTVLIPYVTNLVVEWLIIEPSLYFITACLPTMHPLFRLLAPSQLRHMTEAKVAAARHRQSPELNSPTGLGQGDSFTRLRGSDAPASNDVRPAGKAMEVLGAAGGVVPSKVQSRAEGAAASSQVPEIGMGPGAVPLHDLRQVETGERIMVQTEIITSQEERIEQVIGF